MAIDEAQGSAAAERPLRGKVALVTGAGRGIGRAVSLSLAQAGAHVVLVARSVDQLEKVAAEITAAGGSASLQRTDVSREDDVTALFAGVRTRQGRLDVLVNNAGVGRFGPLADFSAADFDQVLATNLRGTFLCCREALRIYREQRGGTIVNMASVVAFRGYAQQGAYSASKHGVLGLTRSIAAEAHELGVRVSAVLPGGVATDMIGDARPDIDRSTLLQPEDVARTVMFLVTLPPRAAVDEIYIRRSASRPV